MKKLFLLCCFIAILAGCHQAKNEGKTVGVIVPLQHPAMTEIVAGFKQELAKKYPHPVNVVVKNAQHDANLQRSIVQQFIAQNVDVLAPIGTDSFEMTVTSAKQIPVVGIAADIDETQHQALLAKQHQVTNILDEVDIPSQLSFIQCAIPEVKKITLIHSASDKFIRQARIVKQAAKTDGIIVQDLLVQQPSDMYTISQRVARDSNAIFILKDSLIVSGIATLVKQAESLHIPLISSDDGSVQGGAAFAVGVYERQTGILAADVTARILNGEKASNIPMQTMMHYNLFINQQHAPKQAISLASLKDCAKQSNYPVEMY